MTYFSHKVWRYLASSFAVLLSMSLLVQSVQAAGSASTLPGQEPGTPVGAFQISGLDTVNLFNGHLNFRLPLLEIGGRGQAAFSLGLPIDHRWLLLPTSPDTPDTFIPAFISFTSLTPGFMRARHLSDGCEYGVFFETDTQTILTFTTPNGTEIEFRDSNFTGQKTLSQCNQFDPGAGMANRGRFFFTEDQSFTFISDTDIFDMTQATNPILTKPSGYLLMKDGTRYRVTEGQIKWIRDRNGNLLTFNYESSIGRLTGIKDSLNREVAISYTNFEPNPFNTTITYKGFGGLPRTIAIEVANLSELLVEGTTQTYQQLFGIGTNDQFNPSLVKSVRLPDNRTFQMRYNKYGELSRVELPTGGVFTYQWASGNPQNPNGLAGKFVDRRVIKKSIYKDAANLVGSTSFGLFETHASGASGSAKIRELDQFDNPITDERHYFHGIPIDNTNYPFGYIAPPLIGREYQTDVHTANGATLLRKIEHIFDAFGINIAETSITIADVSPNLVSKQTFTYDGFFNLTDTYEYDFGPGTPGPFVRRSHIDYVTDTTYTGTNLTAVYAGTAAHLRSLPLHHWTSSDMNGVTKKSLVDFEYDNYSVAALTPRANITGLCTTFDAVGICSNTNPTSYTTRGNVTKVTSYSNASAATGAINVASQYDIAGNQVQATDGRGFVTQFGFADCYGSPDANAQNCGGAPELGSQASYAFATSITNPLNHISRTQFDYYLGRPVDAEDPNGVVSSVFYDDLLDRPQKFIRAANQGASVRSQTIIEHDDTNRIITTSNDLTTFNDRAIVSKVFYDGLGRTTETRQYEDVTNYIATLVEYDALSRAFKTSNPFRPLQGQPALWTIQAFDALGRTISVTTPDSAVVTTNYSGDRVLVTDQQGKKRMSRTNALGHLTDVFEVTPNDPAQYPGIETESFGAQQLYGYKTQYQYDVIDNLVKVIQGTQQRFFMYDSLRRLLRARNPEQNINPALDISDSVTGNSQWTMKYQYDNGSNLEQKTDARNISITYAYDALNRNTSVNYSNTSIGNPDVPDIQRIYDNSTPGAFGIGRLWHSYANGNETVGSNVEKISINSYDALGRSKVLWQRFKSNTTWSSSTYETSRVYDLAGNVNSQTYPSLHAVSYHYDSAGRADIFTGNLGDGNSRTYSTGIIYSPFGGLAKEQFGTAITLYNKLFYNNRGQLAEVRVGTTYTGPTDTGSQRGAIINHYSAQCAGACLPTSTMTDNNGNVRQQDHWIPNSNGTMQAQYVQNYDYDALNRLKRVSEGANWTQEYVYDRWGNRRIHQTNTIGFPKPDFGVNTGKNQLTAPAGFTMGYDEAGNLTTDTFTGTGNGTRVYDAENRMTQAWGGANQLQFYTYAADGQRTRRKINGQETWQIYGFDGELLAEYAVNASHLSPQKEYGYRNGQLLITAESAGNPTLPLFADDFNDNLVDPSKWTIIFPTGTPAVSEESQQIRMTLAPNTAGYNGVSSISTFDVTGRMVQVEVVQAVSQAGWCENMLELELNANNYFLIDVGAGSLLMRSRVNGANDQTSIGYDPVNHRHWRIRHDASANTVNFETSADGTVWITRKIVTPGFALTSLRIHLIAGAWGTGNSSPGLAKYDNLKLLSSAGPSSIAVPNGGFETPSLGYGNFQYGPTGGSWTFSNGGGITAGGSGFTGGAYVPEGAQVAFIQASGEFSQSLSGFQANTNYVITFFAAQRTNCCNAGGQDFAAYLDNTLLGTFHPPANGSYVEFSTSSFTTTAGSHTVKFVGLNPLGGDHTAFVDHIRITGSPVVGNGVQWLVSDHLGTPRMILDESGSLGGVKRHDYLPFGEDLFGGTAQTPGAGGRLTDHGYTMGDSVRQQFTEKERDVEIALDYFDARYFSSSQGRFTTVDPENYQAWQHLSNPQSWNAYSYVNNNPLRYIDPDGNALDDPSLWQQLKEIWHNGTTYGYWMTNAELHAAATAARTQVAVEFGIVDTEGNYRPIDLSRKSDGEALRIRDDLVTLRDAGQIQNMGDRLPDGPAMQPPVGLGGTQKPENPKANPNQAKNLEIDATGKVHGNLPRSVPKQWTREQLEDSASALRQSIANRKAELRRLGEHGPHRARIGQEERLLRQIEKKLSGS